MLSHMYVFSHIIGLLHAPHWLPRTSDCLQTPTNHFARSRVPRAHELLTGSRPFSALRITSHAPAYPAYMNCS